MAEGLIRYYLLINQLEPKIKTLEARVIETRTFRIQDV